VLSCITEGRHKGFYRNIIYIAYSQHRHSAAALHFECVWIHLFYMSFMQLSYKYRVLMSNKNWLETQY